MPIYQFECYEDDGGCGNSFDIKCSMNEIQEKKPCCPKCKKKTFVARNFANNLYIYDSSPKTVGTLAERNSAKMSNDQMNEIKNKHRLKPKFSGSLPEGGSIRTTPSSKKGQDFGRPYA